MREMMSVPPPAVEAILVVVRGIDRELVDVDEVGIVDGAGPAEMLVMAVQHER